MNTNLVSNNSDKNNIVKSYKGYTVFFILHALTLITAFTWHQLIQDYIGSFKNINVLKLSTVFTLFITLFSVAMHVYFGKYSIQPDDM